jgi:hypothetical protein
MKTRKPRSRRNRRTNEQIQFHATIIIERLDAGIPTKSISHELGITDQAVYNQARGLGYQQRLVRQEMLKQLILSPATP